MSVPDAASVVATGFVAPLLLWRGWETNKSEVERLRDFLDYGQGLLNDVEHLAVEDYEDLQIDLNSVRTGFLNLRSKPAVLRWSGYTQYAEDLAALKRRVEDVTQRFGQRLNIDTSRKVTATERYQRKVFSFKKRGNSLFYLQQHTPRRNHSPLLLYLAVHTKYRSSFLFPARIRTPLSFRLAMTPVPVSNGTSAELHSLT